MLSMAEEAGGHLEAAQDAARSATERDPADASAFAAWVRIAMRRGDAEGARDAARGLRKLAPRHPLVAEVLGDSAAAAR